ncbi:MAG TPA: ribosome biogenesis GTP-binding protein YihA/YsxC [Oscillospiraceae bacterium]|nr:YihA family ribosome biogenesis GTP-binding protein [Oscillospiraceae bacterium]HNW03940.1 ribosome biogenesis GTP-binding protein YihA/YsxC [Oscillospiraceae bacterium]
MDFRNVTFEAAYGTPNQLPPSSSAEFAFSGHSNVGKSSLINKIFGRKSLARVSSQPGKTATVNFFEADGVRFVDLPGYGYAKVSLGEKKRWAGLVEGYLTGERDIRLVVQLIDSRHEPTRDDLDMIRFLIDSEMPFVLALTKCDKLNRAERQSRTEALAEEIPCADQITMLFTSTETGEGIEELKAIFADLSQDE